MIRGSFLTVFLERFCSLLSVMIQPHKLFPSFLSQINSSMTLSIINNSLSQVSILYFLRINLILLCNGKENFFVAEAPYPKEFHYCIKNQVCRNIFKSHHSNKMKYTGGVQLPFCITQLLLVNLKLMAHSNSPINLIYLVNNQHRIY